MSSFEIKREETKKNYIRENLFFEPTKDLIYAAKRRLDTFIEEHEKDPFLVKYISLPQENKIALIIQSKTNPTSFFSSLKAVVQSDKKPVFTLEQARDMLINYLSNELRAYEALYDKMQNNQNLKT